MNNIKNSISQIKEQLETNQQEYKEKQNILLKQIEEIQRKCPHNNTSSILIGKDICIKCNDCEKMVE